MSVVLGTAPNVPATYGWHVWVACMGGMQIKRVLRHVQAARLVKPDKLQHIDARVSVAK